MVTENQYAHFLYNVPGLGSRGIFKLLEGGRTCEEIYKMDEPLLVALVKEKLNKVKVSKEIIHQKKVWNFEKEEKRLRDSKIRFISTFSDEFPDRLRNIPDPPFGIYVKGKLPDPNVPSVSIIGARMCSDYGRYMSREFGKGLALAGVQVISGMARGVDGISQKAAIEAGGSSFGVLGCSVDICYPEENKDVYNNICINGGLISEYHPGTEPKSNFFPMRNRIISALADIVLVVEARQKSGTQITVDQALEQGREVLAIPGRVTDRLSDGCNYLISQGAGVALGVQDVLDRLWRVRNAPTIRTTCMSEGIGEKSRDCNGYTEENVRKEYEQCKSHAEENIRKEYGECKSHAEENVRKEYEECICHAEERRNEKDINYEKTIDEEIFDIIDIIPISASTILEKLHSKDIDLSIPQLMSNLMELTFQGRIIQDGVYYRKRLG